MDISVILVNPKYGGNIGSIARCMKNFNVKDLRIVGNRDILNKEAYMFSVHAKDILDSAKFYNTLEEAIEDIDITVGTSGIVSGDRNLKRVPISPKDLAKNQLMCKGRMGLIFGREDDGLYSEEIELCDLFVAIPTSEEYPIMNLSHAVAVILYELYSSSVDGYENINIREASKLEKDILIEIFNNFVDKKDNIPDYRKNLCKIIFKRIIGRAFISGKEAHTLMCVFKEKKQNNP